MNIVIDTVKKYITREKTRFVFPSQAVADMWARKICTLRISRSIALERFLAWDRFKAEITEEKERKPVTAVMQKLFAEALARKNAEAAQEKRAFLDSVIPREFAGAGIIFASYIARLLPTLAYWERILKSGSQGKKQKYHPDREDADFTFIKNEYKLFLDRNNLFDPSWEEINIRKGSVEYVIFFPELIEDYSEYEALLRNSRFIKIDVDKVQCKAGPLTRFRSVREEIRSAVIEIEKLHREKGIPYENMALSVPELEEMEPCLIKEFHLRHIPITRRTGKPLGETGAGKLFRLINEYALSRYSFVSLKALVLDDHIPWKDKEKNKELIRFGIEFNCVSGYADNGKTIDIWEEAFRKTNNREAENLRSYYCKLKKHILDLAGSKNFRDLRKNYFAFRGGQNKNALLDMETILPEDDAVLGRCIEELSTLIKLENTGEPALTSAEPFAFFVSCLGEKEYVRAKQEPGVNIFKWRVAAASPFDCHFILNASQSAAPVLYRPLSFLRQDKRKALGLEDQDATPAFFSLYDTGDDGDFTPRIRISASVQTFSGWAIPHSFFAQGQTIDAPPRPPEPYEEERYFWKCFGSRNAALRNIYPLQKTSFDNWKRAFSLKGSDFSFLRQPVPTESAARELIKKALPQNGEVLTVTPTTDLNVFYKCSMSWLLERIFRIKELTLKAVLLDDIRLGLLYHRILEGLFRKIKSEDAVFNAARLEIYARWALDIIKDEIKKEDAFKGPLAFPLVSSQAAGMAGKIYTLLLNEAKLLDHFRIAELEFLVQYQSGDFLIKGIIDRISLSPEGFPVIVDYKTGSIPRQTETGKIDEFPLQEFQMPLYIKLYEETGGKAHNGKPIPVEGAFFYNITGGEFQIVVGEKARANSKTLSRDEYEVILGAAEKQIEEFGQRVRDFDFAPRQIRIKDCGGCKFKTICRSTYFLNAAPRTMGQIADN